MNSRHRHWAVCAVLALCLPGAALAAPDPVADAVLASPSSGASLPPRAIDAIDHAHRKAAARTPVPQPPRPDRRTHLFADYDLPDDSVQAKATTACTPQDFASVPTAALPALVAASDTSCINPLFSLTSTQAAQVFAEPRMVAVANALQDVAARYTGSNQEGILSLILFLRAGYYVQYYDPAVGDYGAPLRNAIRPALDAFVARPAFAGVSAAHGAVLGEFVTLIDSSGENARYLDALRRLLDGYGAAHRSVPAMQSATNSVFTVLFRGHYDDAFRAAALGSSGIAMQDSLYDFVQRNRAADVGTAREYLVLNAAAEFARFLQYTSLRPQLRPRAKSLLDAFTLTGPGAAIHVTLADVIGYYDAGNCAYYGLCDFRQRLEALVLPPQHARECSSTVRVRSQALSATQLDAVCATVAGMDTVFHEVAATGRVPVADDHNARLEMVIFHSSSDYETYSGALFGNSTNNGGIYLEGDPSNPANQARFLAYEAEWLRPAFEVWNLSHEYVHYLDGRFNWHGGFGALPLDPPYSSVWYIEGFAEYLSYGYRGLAYSRALQLAGGSQRYTLSQLFDTSYSHGTDRIYPWGYLATRYLFEQQRPAIDALYALARVGDYASGYRTWLDARRTQHDDAFADWLDCVVANDGGSEGCGVVEPEPEPEPEPEEPGEPTALPECTLPYSGQLDDGCQRSGLSAPTPGHPVYLYLYVPEGQSRLVIEMGGGSGDADLYHGAGSWPSTTAYDHLDDRPGNGGRIVVLAPQPGWHYLTLRPKSASFSGVHVATTLHASSECGGHAEQLGQDCHRSGLSAAQPNQRVYLSVYVPAGARRLAIGMSGGAGDADLYVRRNGWPSETQFDAAPRLPGNREQVVLDNPAAGWNYLMLKPRSTSFADVRVATAWE